MAAFLNVYKIKILFIQIKKLLPGYRGYVVDSFPKLFALDDKQISKEERINCFDYKLLAGKVCFKGFIFTFEYNMVFVTFLKNLSIRKQR